MKLQAANGRRPRLKADAKRSWPGSLRTCIINSVP
jgi:hypothetical protein